MNVKEERANGVLVCILEGEVNINTSPELRKAFDEIIRNKESKVLVDFSSVSYIDSSGLATLIEMLQRLKRAGGRLCFSNMSQKVKNVFEITKLDKLFEIFESRQEALQSL
ncbi:MAG: STAS domain-containing protein [Candidatus Omnitrophica bacterium]|nr:STAS domain-containing protein [Candidatus Omnitrophota bacterium]